jgi:hypothetical protein
MSTLRESVLQALLAALQSVPDATVLRGAILQARRTAGALSYEARAARSIRLFMPDGVKVAEVTVWTGFGADARLSVAETAIWIGFGSDARLTVPGVDIFTEWGGAPRLTSASATLYIEVIP